MNREDLATIVECAQLAPSVHNTQPWTCTVVTAGIEIRADRSRGLAVLDPSGRELMISCGAAIEFAGIAARGLGWNCTTDLLPNPGEPDLLALVRLGARRPAGAEETELLDAIPRRYTDRGTYEPRPLSPDLRKKLQQGVSERGAWLRPVDRDGDRLAVIQALSEADATEAKDPAYRRELADWLRIGHAPDGIPLTALGDVTESGRAMEVPVRDFTGADEHLRPGGDGPPPTVERDVLLMIGTDTDTRLAWIQSGRALGWLLLRLTAAGLSSQPLGQVLDVEGTRLRLARQIGLIGHLQFLLRIGHGHGVAETGRRHATVS
jgi:nitroreductase